jgi:diaminohydroxyphosphoribosylaminopyrimidine deaminase/5-amino-6-(5-phosphoribosylamino)uracil reductase
MPPKSTDELFMTRALELAREGIALASPNPCVGAVVVDERGRIVGSGTHKYEGVKHAEVIALEQAGEQARGNTLYLTLEPCSHQGRTGPCADAVIAAGLGRVVIAMRDPNPLVSGKGIEKVRAAGIDVTEGVLEADAKKLNEGWAKYIRTKLPFVTLKAAMTLDGKIAPPPGESDNPTALGAGTGALGWITSEVARAHVQELRHAHDAILVGVGTVIADDPLLTDRTGLPRRRPLLRVVLDSRLRIPMESRIVKTAKDDVIVFSSFCEEKKKKELEARGVCVEQIRLEAATGESSRFAKTPHDGRPDLQKMLVRLGELEITGVMIEGGSMVNWAALAAGIVDKVFFYYAPKILGGTGSVSFALGAGFRKISEAAYLKNVTVHRFGEDFAVEGYLKEGH